MQYEMSVIMKKYTKNHLWFECTTNKIGVTEFLVENLGEIDYFDLPKIGDWLTLNEAFGSFESAKMAMELIAPISGRVVAVNESPKNSQWLIELEGISGDELLTKDEYDEFILRNFA